MVDWRPPASAPIRIALLGDIHGNALALRGAIDTLRTEKLDRVMILGDLLTYGCHPAEVLELTQVLIDEFAADLLLGNHDQLYLDQLTGDTEYYDGLPDWLRESIDWTCTHIDLDHLRALPWRERIEYGPLLVAHANPFTYGDWTYLNGPDDNRRAIATLDQLGFSVGVFGHTHRRKLASLPAGASASDDSADVALSEDSTFLARAPGVAYAPVAINAGSVGQPRHRDKRSTMLLLDIRPDGLNIEFLPIAYPLDEHLNAIAHSTLSATTRARLGRYF